MFLPTTHDAMMKTIALGMLDFINDQIAKGNVQMAPKKTKKGKGV